MDISPLKSMGGKTILRQGEKWKTSKWRVNLPDPSPYWMELKKANAAHTPITKFSSIKNFISVV